MNAASEPLEDPDESVGSLLRLWRQRRTLTQLELANQAEVSTRHLSFVETGRSQPSRAVLARLSDELDLPLRERNQLLLVAGYAPEYRETPMASTRLAPALTALRATLDAHSPYPAVLIDRHWNLIDANAAVALFLEGVAPDLLEPPANVLKLTLDPRGMAPRIPNFDEWCEHLLHRLSRQIAVSADIELVRLQKELLEIPHRAGGTVRHRSTSGVVVPLLYHTADRVLSFISTTMVLGAPIDVTTDELAVECFYPADTDTADYLRQIAQVAQTAQIVQTAQSAQTVQSEGS
ncbi:helix-turn-helix domain-containing protein [Rathayibacter soli]|uniref:helix-turn-helix domain-containing protein n=1 Tax=Rathayibacter soli TaxID=3144168 RepID=UPI0027E3B7C3|nr:helix-turn-helix transcriptional regulator [Glaciibacter superstes]